MHTLHASKLALISALLCSTMVAQGPSLANQLEITTPLPAAPLRQVAPPMVPPPAGISELPGYQSNVVAQAPIAPSFSAGYWRVGTRRAGQEFNNGILTCPLDVEVCDPSGKPQPANLDMLLGSLQPGVPICIFVHGSMVDEPGSRVDSHGTYHWLRRAVPNRPMHIIAFDWPSMKRLGLLPGKDYVDLGEQAARNGFPLAALVQRLPASNPISLIGHSHGGRVVTSAAHLLGGGQVQGYRLTSTSPHRLRVFLFAAAIDHDWLNPGERYCRALPRAECIVSVRNRKDFALSLYPLQRPFTPLSIGQRGLSSWDTQALGPNRAKFQQLDATPIVSHGHLWPNYYKSAKIGQWVGPAVYFAR